MTYGPPTTGPDAPGEGPDNASTLVLNGKAPAARPAAEPPAEQDPLTGTLPLADVPVVAPPAPPAPERAKPTVTVLPVAAPPVGAPASRLLSAVAAVAADGEVPTACLTRGGGAVTCPQPPAAAAPPQPVPTGARPKLRVTRGQRVNVEYPLFDGPNLIGRRDDKPVDVNLEDQEPADRIWSSRQHAVITVGNGGLAIEDLNSLNGTFVNRVRIYPGQKRGLSVNDVIQVGTVQMKVTT